MNQIKIIEIGLTGMCNLKCPLCTRAKIIFKDKDSYPKFKPVELEFNTLLNFIKFINPDEIKLVGAIGEPTLYSRFYDLLLELNKLNIKIWLSTNGSTHNKEWWEKIATTIPKNSIINIDMDSSTDNNYYRKGSDINKIKEVLSTLTDKNNNGYTVRLQKIDFDWNKNDKLDTILNDKIELYEIPCYDFNPDEFLDKTLEEKYSHPKLDIYKQLNKWKQKAIENNSEHLQKIECDSKVQNLIYLNYLGEVLPCCYINDTSLKEKKLRPTIYNTKFETLLNDYYNNINNPVQPECKWFCAKKCRKLYKEFGLDP